jgi:predicted SprT family Zn-dependent metalloprotease
MVAVRTSTVPMPPPRQADHPIIHGSSDVERWLAHYWQKLQLPAHELGQLAITQDRREYMRWTGKRLNTMVLGCYCYLPSPHAHHAANAPHGPHAPHALRISSASNHRHLIFVESAMQPQSIEVTVAHELIHLADRVHGTPRRHHHHGYDSIAADEAAITGYGLEELRHLLHEESLQREHMRRERRPIRYLYECPNCSKQYPRARRYSHPVSCSNCDKTYNPNYKLQLRS